MLVIRQDRILYRTLFWTLICILIILSGANTDNMDLESSIYEYENYTESRQGEWLNFLIEEFFRINQLSFEYYRLALHIGGYVLIFSTFYKFFGINFYLILLYAIYPFTIDFIQTPNFCSMCFIIFSTRFLIELTIRNILKFVTCIMLAAGMHSMAYLYLGILVLMYYMRDKDIFRVGKSLLVCGILLGIVDRIVGFIYPLMQFVTNNDDRLSLYFGGYTKLGFILYWITQILLWYMMKYIVEKVEIANKHNDITETRIIKYLKLIYIVTCFGLLLMPLVGYAGTMFRLVRNYYVLVYAAWAYYLKYYGTIKEKYVLGAGFMLFPIFMYAIESFDVHFYVINILNNNRIINN